MRNTRFHTVPIVTGMLLFLVVPLLQPALACAGEAADGRDGSDSGESQFIIRLRPARPQESATEEEKVKIVQHFEYLQRLFSQGKLILAGMALDDYEGIVVLRAADRLEAERILAGDPAVGANVLLAELHPFTVTLLSGGR